MPDSARRMHGFTLIEVLVALAILAIALAAAARAASVATDSATEVRLRTLATWVAQNRIAELNATAAFPAAGAASGKSTMAANEFDWQQTISGTPNAAFRKITLTVSRAGNLHTLITMHAYLVQAPGNAP